MHDCNICQMKHSISNMDEGKAPVPTYCLAWPTVFNICRFAAKLVDTGLINMVLLLGNWLSNWLHERSYTIMWSQPTESTRLSGIHKWESPESSQILIVASLNIPPEAITSLLGWQHTPRTTSKCWSLVQLRFHVLRTKRGNGKKGSNRMGQGMVGPEGTDVQP